MPLAGERWSGRRWINGTDSRAQVPVTSEARGNHQSLDLEAGIPPRGRLVPLTPAGEE